MARPKKTVTTAAAPPQPPNRRESRITDADIAATQLTAAEREQQAREAQHADKQAEAVMARINGGGMMDVADAAELPIVLGRTPAAAAMESVPTVQPFFSQPPPGIAPETSPATEPRAIAENSMLAQSRRGEAEMNDQFEHLENVSTTEFQQAPPEAMFGGMRPRPTFAQRPHQPDAPPAQAVDEVNPIAKIFGSQIGIPTRDSFPWCRDADGSEAKFTIVMDDIAVIVDMFTVAQFRSNEKAIRAEIRSKTAAIDARNDEHPELKPWGYLAVVAGYTVMPSEIEDIRNGYVCKTLRVGPLPEVQPDRYDSARAATGDPLAGASGGNFDAQNWNKPRGWAGAALAAAR